MKRLIAIAVLGMCIIAPSLAQEASRYNAEELLLTVEKNPLLFQAATK